LGFNEAAAVKLRKERIEEEQNPELGMLQRSRSGEAAEGHQGTSGLQRL